MNIYLYSVYKSLISRFNKFTTLSNFSIFFSTFLCLLLLIVTLNVSDGFKNNIIKKIKELDGSYHVYTYDNTHLDTLKMYNNSLNYTFDFYPYMQTYSILRFGGKSEGVTIISLHHKDKFKKFIINTYTDDSGIYVGEKLADKLKIKNNMITAIFIDDNKNKYLKNLKVKGVYKTNIPSYDEHVVFSDYNIDENLEIFNTDNINEFIVFTDISDDDLFASHSHYYVENWRTRNYDFFNWLNSYDIPIKILLTFLVLVLFINNVSMFNLDFVNKYEEIVFYKSIGLNSKSTFIIFMFKFIFLTLFGTALALFVAFLLSYLQANYNLISIAPGIYFSKYLPIDNNINNYIYSSLSILFLNMIIPLLFKKQFYSINK